MRSHSFGWRSGLFLCAVALALAALGVFEPTASRAGDSDTVRLLVKCERKALPDILRGLAAQGAEVWDLESMQSLSVPAPTPPTPTPASLALPDAVRVMQEVYAALSAGDRERLGTYFQIEEMVIRERRAIMRYVTDDVAAFDEVRRRLAGNAYLRSRVLDPQRLVEPSAQQKLANGRWQQGFSLRFREDVAGEPRPGRSAASILTPEVQRHALEARLLMQYVGPEKDDPNRGRGFRTISREFTFGAAPLSNLTRFLHGISSDPAGLTVLELRWKLADPKERKLQDLVKNPVVKLAIRLPLAR